ncbi:MAG: carboxypeptidase regulatory-like domain-containing protein [Rhodothermales bacterium]|nr:carboxypeptidase regulatory-like domain-containing protein [Rhodothermales bacterium]
MARFLCVLLALALAGCLGDAPRENPLDPLADGFRAEGAVTGRVIGAHPPFPPREGVQVRFVPLGGAGRAELVTRSDAEGRFALSEVAAGEWAIVAEGEAFRADADTVTVVVGEAAEVTLELDALPHVVAQDLRTVHLARWPPFEELFQLEVEVTVEDPDRPDDVAGAALVVEELGFRAALAEVEGAPQGTYAATFDAADLPGGRVQTLLGRSLRVEVEDEDGESALGPPMSLVRVIEQVPQPLSPISLETVGTPTPTLRWRLTQLPFAFTHRVDVFVVAGDNVATRLFVEEGIDPFMTAFTVPDPLPTGEYFWTLWIVDEAGNRSRSREAGFRVP